MVTTIKSPQIGVVPLLFYNPRAGAKNELVMEHLTSKERFLLIVGH